MAKTPDSLFRSAVPADAVRLSNIEHQVSAGPWSLAQFISACRSDREQVCVACEPDGDVQGFAVFSEVLGEASLLNLAVDSCWQGRGIGHGLLQAVLAELRAQGCTRMVLEVRSSNHAAIALYRGVGFVDDGIRKGYYPSGGGREDALLMSLDMVENL